MRLQGVVKTIQREKGYAFLSGDDGIDQFLHLSQLPCKEDFDSLIVGDRVEYSVTYNERAGKTRAINARVL
jgi:cold shock CspA family protein